MINYDYYKEKFDEHKVCVIIPTYNNSGTLRDVIKGVLNYTNNIIIVNDGSTDTTKAIIESIPDIQFINLPKNKGKGFALRQGFKSAAEKGYKYAISIDADGQHSSDDLPKFIDKLEEETDALIIGSRDMDREGIPGKSNFGRKFSNFWFHVETGLKEPDTQSGYRLYPLELINQIKFFTHRFEFEIEAIVRAAWNDIKIVSVPVYVHYDEETERTSHFRTVRDFARISVLNTILVTIAFLYIKPFNLIRHLRRKTIKEFFREQILGGNDSNLKIVFSIMLGIFMGVVPIWGYQLALAIMLAYVLKLNKMIVAVTANISLPPMIPFILYLSYKTGGIVLGHHSTGLSLVQGLSFDFIKKNIVQYVVGSLCFAVILSLVMGLLAFILLEFFRKKRPVTDNNLL